jgi:integrase
MENNLYIEQDKESLSLNTKLHKHNFKQIENFMICEICGKKLLNLNNTKEEGILIGKKSDGKSYKVRTDRRRYFFPDEWVKFIDLIKNKKHHFFFITAVHTGGRIMEILNLRYKDIDEERGTITFSIVKQRKAKKNFYATGKTRGFFVASEFIKEYKSFIRGKTINKDEFIFLDNEKLPNNFSEFENSKRKPYYMSKVVSYSKILKLYLKKAGIKDYYNFSPHNLRKTYGMWMRTFNKDMGELCYRLGHDLDTFMLHYGSSLIFTEEERRKISKIMGDVN